MSADRVTQATLNRAAIGKGSPPVLDPLAGIPNIPQSAFFARDLKFLSVMDSCGRIKLGAFTIESDE